MSMRKAILLGSVLVIVAVIAWTGIFAYRNLRGIGPAFAPPPADIAKLAAENNTGLPLKFPEGFSIEIFAKDLAGVRVLAFDSVRNLWVSRTSEGIISRIVSDDKAGVIYRIIPLGF